MTKLQSILNKSKHGLCTEGLCAISLNGGYMISNTVITEKAKEARGSKDKI